jgi:hypothetical protein
VRLACIAPICGCHREFAEWYQHEAHVSRHQERPSENPIESPTATGSVSKSSRTAISSALSLPLCRRREDARAPYFPCDVACGRARETRCRKAALEKASTPACKGSSIGSQPPRRRATPRRGRRGISRKPPRTRFGGDDDREEQMAVTGPLFADRHSSVRRDHAGRALAPAQDGREERPARDRRPTAWNHGARPFATPIVTQQFRRMSTGHSERVGQKNRAIENQWFD